MRKLWFKTGAFYTESLRSFRIRMLNKNSPDLVFAKYQAD